jgi:hypothetical protein
MTEDQLDFFNLEKPCPSSIINCEKVREQYKNEKEDLIRRGGCGGCLERSLKSRYMALITALTKNS